VRRIHWAAFSFAAAGTIAQRADAYTLRLASDGNPVHWNTETVTLVVDPSVGDIDPSAPSAVSAAMGAWDAVPSAYAPGVVVQGGDADEVGYRPGGENHNTVRYDAKGSALAGPALAITVVTFDATGVIVDADIVINGGPARKFALVDPASDQGAAAPGYEKTHYDLQNVLTHEAGHFFGLGENMTDADATMFITSAPAEITKRDLTVDDESGLRTIYQSAPDVASAGACSMRARPRDVDWTVWLGVAALGLGIGVAVRRRRVVLTGGAALVMAGALGPLGAGRGSDEAPADRHASTEANGGADAIARVTSARARWDAGIIMTELTLDATCITASCSAGAFSIEVAGGTLGGYTQIVGHDAVPRVGARLPLHYQNGRLVWANRAPERRGEPTNPTERRDPRPFVALSTNDGPKADPRRAHDRVPSAADVVLRSVGESAVGVVENLSSGGLFVATDAACEVGSLVDLEIRLGEQNVIRTKVEVRWNRSATGDGSAGFGARFLDLSPEDAILVGDYVNEHYRMAEP
jgi:uncharacterized protein (TIGR02266 family)